MVISRLEQVIRKERATLRSHRRRIRLLVDLLVLGLLVITVASVTNVSTAVDADDVRVFEESLGLTPADHRPPSFEREVALIREVQAAVLAAAPINRGIPEFESREPATLIRLGYGLCYDRSRTIDKALAFVGFEPRHVYVLYGQGRPLWRALLTYRQPSHAVTEVRTSRGWMVVDSNSPWIALTREGEPVPMDSISSRAAEFAWLPDNMDEQAWAIRGLYSRKGFFYRPFIPFPEANWLTLLSSLFE